MAEKKTASQINSGMEKLGMKMKRKEGKMRREEQRKKRKWLEEEEQEK